MQANFLTSFEAKLPVCWLVGRSVGLSVCHNFLKGQESYTSMLLLEHLLSFIITYHQYSTECMAKQIFFFCLYTRKICFIFWLRWDFFKYPRWLQAPQQSDSQLVGSLGPSESSSLPQLQPIQIVYSVLKLIRQLSLS